MSAKPNPLAPGRISPTERRAELCGLLALGLVRLRLQQSSELSAAPENSSLVVGGAVTRTQSVWFTFQILLQGRPGPCEHLGQSGLRLDHSGFRQVDPFLDTVAVTLRQAEDRQRRRAERIAVDAHPRRPLESSQTILARISHSSDV